MTYDEALPIITKLDQMAAGDADLRMELVDRLYRAAKIRAPRTKFGGPIWDLVSTRKRDVALEVLNRWA